ncbi:FAD-dependent oxidoreductase [Streptomyces roseofulvus]|uniref:FAD-dependent oxidoreductase n=1 Tax=Streptomyces roseofulvus TaxID=33902 RepID=UPI0031FBBEF6
MSGIGREGRRRQVLSDLTYYSGAEPVAWTVDPWAEGGYGAHMPPGVVSAYGDVLRERSGRMQWAGTETATECIGYFEGALQSGIRAAREVLGAG